MLIAARNDSYSRVAPYWWLITMLRTKPRPLLATMPLITTIAAVITDCRRPALVAAADVDRAFVTAMDSSNARVHVALPEYPGHHRIMRRGLETVLERR